VSHAGKGSGSGTRSRTGSRARLSEGQASDKRRDSRRKRSVAAPAHVGFEFELRSAEIRGAGKIGTVPAFPRPAAMAVRPAFADLNGLQVRLRWHYDEITGVIFGNWASAKLWQGYEADL
jgi:hypothetical protein